MLRMNLGPGIPATSSFYQAASAAIEAQDFLWLEYVRGHGTNPSQLTLGLGWGKEFQLLTATTVTDLSRARAEYVAGQLGLTMVRSDNNMIVWHTRRVSMKVVDDGRTHARDLVRDLRKARIPISISPGDTLEVCWEAYGQLPKDPVTLVQELRNIVGVGQKKPGIHEKYDALKPAIMV